MRLIQHRRGQVAHVGQKSLTSQPFGHDVLFHRERCDELDKRLRHRQAFGGEGEVHGIRGKQRV